MFLNMNLKMFLHIDMAFIAYLNQLFIISYVITPFLALLKIIIQIYDICNERSHEIVIFTKMEVQPATNYLSMFDHFVGLALKGITYWSSVQIYHTFLLDIGWYNIRRQKYEWNWAEYYLRGRSNPLFSQKIHLRYFAGFWIRLRLE